MADEKRLDEELAGLEPSRRAFIKRVAIGAAFAAPIVSSFSMSGLNTAGAAALASNQSGQLPDNAIEN